MAYIKLYEQFLNEANELIKAQGMCKNTMFQVQKEVENLFKDMVKKGLADSFTTKIEPWNNGYQLKTKVDTKSLWRKEDRKEISDEIASFAYKIAGSGSLYLQPGTFFDDYFEEGKGAKIEGHVFEIVSKQSYDVTYPKWDITNKNDIPKAGKEYLDIIKNQITEIRKQLEL